MPEDGQPPGDATRVPPLSGGATTVPPPPVSLSAPFVPGKVFLVPRAVPPGPSAPKRPAPRRRLPWRWWARQLVPLGGLALMAGCLHGLLAALSAVTWPSDDGGSVTKPAPFGGGGGPVAVVIDPGHGGVDTGATALGLQEKWLNLDVARRVGQTLEHAGVRVRLTRDADQAVSLEERVRIGNATPGAIFVSIHFNDALTAASGVETYYSEHKEAGLLGSDWMWTSLFGGRSAGAARGREALAWSAHEGATLADAIQGSLVLATSAADRGTKERSLYVTRKVRAPAVLVEGGFISHPSEAKRLGDPAYRQKLADAIAGGIINYLQAADQPSGSGAAAKPPAGA